MLNHLRPTLVLFALFSLLTGVIYPLATTGFAQVLFPDQARGSLIERDGKLIGSSLIGQNFAGESYFHPRPSGAGADGYDAASSSGSNLGPTSKPLLDALTARVAAAQAQNPGAKVPLEWVTASGSGLDPHISPASAQFQVPRIARARSLAEAQVQQLVEEHTQGRTLGLLGEPRVNVLQLNLLLDDTAPVATP